jgi:hypothetical protein
LVFFCKGGGVLGRKILAGIDHVNRNAKVCRKRGSGDEYTDCGGWIFLWLVWLSDNDLALVWVGGGEMVTEVGEW